MKDAVDFDKAKHIFKERRETIEQIGSLIELLDDKAINDLYQLYDRDLNKIWDVLYEETHKVLFLQNPNINTTELNYLPNLKEGYEEYLRKANLNYFVASVLPEFELTWHCVEWMNLIQMYKYLCVIAARDHCFGKDTEVRMFDGSVKKIQDIEVGDQVMGIDSTPRNVLKVHKGIDNLFTIKSQNDEYDYVANSLHDIVLVNEKGLSKISAQHLYFSSQILWSNDQLSVVDGVQKKVPIKNISFCGRGEYFGFECDGDHLFLLSSGLVVHNSKSYTFSFANLLWKMYRYEKPTELYRPSLEIKLCKEGMLITNEYKLAKRLLKKVKKEIEENPILEKRLCPGKNAEGWANESLVCKNGAELTLSSYRSPNRGPHPGHIVVDDFLDKSCLYSSEARERFNEVFFAEILNMIVPNGQVLVVGTVFHQQDLYSKLKEDDAWKVFEYPAIFPDGRVLWESRYNYEDLLRKRRSLGNLIFSREILVRPISDSISIFPWNILELAFINMGKISLVSNRASYAVKMKKVSVGCDFALSGAASADYSVFSVWGIDDLDQVHLMHLIRLHGASYNEQLAHLTRIQMAFQPEIFVMEVNGFQRVMAQMAKDRGINNIIEFNTNGFNKKDMYEGLPSLAVMFETGIIKLPRGDEFSIVQTDMLCNELNSMAFDQDSGKLESVSGHDDISLSMFFGIKGLKQVHSGLRVSFVSI